MNKRAVLHIPHTEMLALKPIDEWVRAFASEKFARTAPTEIVLPAVGLGGPSFQSKVHPYPRYLEPPKDAKTGRYIRPFDLLPDWIEQCREINPEMRVWAFVNPVYAFLDGEYTRLLDQHGITLDNNMCITNEVIQKMTDVFIDELAAMNVDGVVFDLTDIYPQSGSNMVVGVQNTCFCPYCLDALAAEGYHKGSKPFVGPQNPFRLLLRVDSDGTAHIPVEPEWSPSYLVKLSLARGFIEEDDAQVQRDAKLLLSYLQARSRVVAQSVKRLAKRAREQGKKTAVILGDKHLDLTTMTDIKTLQRYDAVDEFWMPEVDRQYVLQQQVQVCVYLWSRATYSINAFFEIFEEANTVLALRGVEEFLKGLLHRSKRLLGNMLAPGNVFTAEIADEFQGFVGIPLSESDHTNLVNLLSKRATGQILPPEILDAFRITTPTGATERRG
ncbi:MAG: hypothetical protein D6732_02460 [Methanobacteriota archaeon]|nr:MAG: hypothetical protein D6732_02460 [Euryarchaeota archaeon]